MWAFMSLRFRQKEEFQKRSAYSLIDKRFTKRNYLFIKKKNTEIYEQNIDKRIEWKRKNVCAQSLSLIHTQKPLKQKRTKKNITCYEANGCYSIVFVLFIFFSVDCCVLKNRLESKYTGILNRNRQTFIGKISNIIVNLWNQKSVASIFNSKSHLIWFHFCGCRLSF